MKWFLAVRLLFAPPDSRTNRRPGRTLPARERTPEPQAPVRPKLRRPERQRSGPWQLLKDIVELLRNGS